MSRKMSSQTRAKKRCRGRCQANKGQLLHVGRKDVGGLALIHSGCSAASGGPSKIARSRLKKRICGSPSSQFISKGISCFFSEQCAQIFNAGMEISRLTACQRSWMAPQK
jgi:hypothetical protein